MSEPNPFPPIPRALYSCEYCSESYSWPPEDLFACLKFGVWVCIECWDEEDHGPRGISVADEIARQPLGEVERLRNKLAATQAELDGADTCLNNFKVIVADLNCEVMQLRATVTRLNRRTQAAEKAARTTIEECRRQGVSLGRGLALWGYCELREQRDILRAALQPLADLMDAEEFDRLGPEEVIERMFPVQIVKDAKDAMAKTDPSKP